MRAAHERAEDISCSTNRAGAGDVIDLDLPGRSATQFKTQYSVICDVDAVLEEDIRDVKLNSRNVRRTV